MVIVNINGGIGNQLFQYAAARALALKKKERLFLNTYQLSVQSAKRKLFLNSLQIPFRQLSYPVSQLAQNEYFLTLAQKLFNRVIINEKNIFLKTPPVIILDGYFQGECYFEKYKNTILDEFKLKQVSEHLQTEIAKLRQINTVSIHIRRGDYVHHKSFGLLNIDYYQRAIAEIVKSVSDPFFVLFSDDMPWVMENDLFRELNMLSVRTDTLSDLESLILMSHCRHHIVANSSYSWWGAYLNQFPDKMVIRPQKHWKNEKIDEKIYYPDNWIAVENDFF